MQPLLFRSLLVRAISCPRSPELASLPRLRAVSTSFAAMSSIGASCSLSGGDEAGGVHVGLAASEMVVRGGRLSEPMVFANLFVDEDGRRFLKLRKAHDGLCRFLTGRGSWRSPLAGSSVFETLRVRRNEVVAALVAEAFEPEAGDEEVDPMALLGVDEAVAFEAVSPSRRAKELRRQAIAAQSQKAVAVSLEPDFEFQVRVDSGQSLPSVEVTASSLWKIFQLVNQDLEMPPRKKKASKPVASRAPRGPPGKREYWDNRRARWVQKEALVGSKRHKVLCRRGTSPRADGGLDASGEEACDEVSSQPSSAATIQPAADPPLAAEESPPPPTALYSPNHPALGDALETPTVLFPPSEPELRWGEFVGGVRELLPPPPPPPPPRGPVTAPQIVVASSASGCGPPPGLFSGSSQEWSPESHQSRRETWWRQPM